MRSVFIAMFLVLAGLVPAADAGICLDGYSGCVYFQQALPAYHSFTVEVRFMWESVPPPPTDDGRTIFYDGSGGETGLSYSYDEGVPMLRFSAKVSGHSWQGIPGFSLVPWSDGVPHHLAAVWDPGAGEARVFVDGILIQSASVPGAPLHVSNYGTALGRTGWWNNNYGFGAFEELRFWVRALTQEEIIENMWTPLTGTEPGLVGYWPLDEGTGGIAYDRSLSGNHGQVQGGAVWCVLNTGACCLPDGACVILPEAHCPGEFLGVGSVCDPDPCHVLFGACCFPDGSCTYVFEADCPTGDWRMLELCDPNPCDQPLGACCFEDGGCEVLTEADCDGVWLGIGTSCDPNPCLQPLGACCAIDTGECLVLTQEDCEALPGTEYYGDSVSCDPNPCPPPIPTIDSSWGQIKNRYR